nr:MAG TPA: hypothetical protein [Caudoviricetes sp.]
MPRIKVGGADFSHHSLYINNTYPLRNFPKISLI